MLCFLFPTVHRHISCSSWNRGISEKSWACKKICIACSKSVFSKIFSWIVRVWYWKTSAILSIALRICQNEDIWPIRDWYQNLVSWKGRVKLKACLQALLPFPPPQSTASAFFSYLTPKCFVVLKAEHKLKQ